MESSSPLAQYDQALGPVAAVYRSAPAHLAVLALACRAHSDGIPVAMLRTWMRSRCPGPVADIANDRARFASLNKAAYKKAREVSSLDGRRKAATQTARALVGYLLSPPPNLAAVGQIGTHVRARAALAVMGREYLFRAVHDGYDTVIVPAPHLGVSLGCSTKQAQSTLKSCVRSGWQKKMPPKPGSPDRYELRTRLPHGREAATWAHTDLIDALADEADHPWMTVLRLADHPAVTYAEPGSSPVGHVAWLAGLLSEADVAPGEIGLPDRKLKTGLQNWLALVNTASSYSDDLTTGLDRLAEATGAAAAHRAADDARREATAREYEKRAVVTERRARVRAGLDALLDAAPVPKSTAKESEKDAWVAEVERLLAEDPIPTEMRLDFRRALAHRLATQRYGYPEHVAERVAAMLVPVPEGAPAEAAA